MRARRQRNVQKASGESIIPLVMAEEDGLRELAAEAEREAESLIARTMEDIEEKRRERETELEAHIRTRRAAAVAEIEQDAAERRAAHTLLVETVRETANARVPLAVARLVTRILGEERSP